MPPKLQMAFLLLLLFLVAFLLNPSLKILYSFLLSISITVLADLIFLKLRGVKAFFPAAGLVSGIIIGLLASFNLAWYELATAGILAMLSKHFVRIDKKHIFNPAGFGLLTASLFYHHDISWWGPASLPIVVVFFPGLVSLLRMRRWPMFLAFLTIYFLLLRKIYFDPTVIFFSLVMLPEPMTTPQKPIFQVLFGAFVAIISVMVSFTDPLIFSLLVANAVFFKSFYPRQCSFLNEL